ncbi:MAG: family 20 glycosylhydrolase, partial [Prevotellaceae bacterium]|nr:family 20 glycosylhydrolase [Prevotellaceae bacterium]
GNYMYEQNAFFQTPTELTETDIFPSIKKITKSEGTSLFTKNIKIEHDSEFANEAELLKEKLSSLFGCTVSENGETTVKLTHPNAKLADIKDSYRINVNDNVFEISAGNAKGVFYGCQTLIQILGNFENLPSQISNMDIFDYPDADYRAQMLDVARNFTSKENILKLLDVLSSYKISVFHFHISDDEAWRVEIPGLEELTTVGSRRGHTHDERECLYPAFSWGWDASDKNTLANGYYTRNEFIEILKFAEKRHIKVIPEIDMPGHSRSAIKAMNARYFKYIDTDKAKAEEYLLEDFADTSKYVSAQNFTDNVINVAMPSTYHFVEKIIDEIDKMYSDAGLQLEIFHLGGDEVPNGSWEGSALCTDFMKANNMTEIRELKDYFVEQVLEMFKKRDIQLAAWQDVVSFRNGNPNPKFSDSNILSYCWNTQPVWNSDDIPYKLANAGYPIIFCNVTNFYFDMSYNKHPNEPGLFWGGFVNEFTSFDVLPYDIYKSVRRDLSGNLVDINEASKTKIPLSKDAHNNIIGLQGVFFAETLRSFEQLERNLFPKMFGLIERSWNMTPDWALTQDNSAYENAKQTYNAKITKKEMPRLSKLNVNFRVEQPGIKIENGLLYANTSIADAVIRYTTDGNEPTEKSAIWTSPIECNAKQIKAKTFYIGKESLTTLLANE